MLYYSTNNRQQKVSLKEAIIKGIADDKGLFMPEKINKLPQSFYDQIENLSLQEIAFEVANQFFGEDVDREALKEIVHDSLNFPIPLVQIKPDLYSLELFHGPTLAFKDVGGRFMARILNYFTKNQKEEIIVLAATSGDTGSAVANGFLGVKGIKVGILYPKGKVSKIQEMQFTTLGQNITAFEVDGTFDDCQAMVKNAFADDSLRKKLNLTSANSINIGRLLPQAFYYFHGYAQLPHKQKETIVCVPSGNYGNITAAIIAKRMGLPLQHFIAATNVNDVVPEFLKTSVYTPRPSVQTIANAMDVGNPSNFARILDLYDHSYEAIKADISGYSCSDATIRKTIAEVYKASDYLLDPHGAVGYNALTEALASSNKQGFFIGTAHPAKFNEVVEDIIQEPVVIPERLEHFMHGTKQSIETSTDYVEFRERLIQLGRKN
jgi:threonine synthase